MNDANNKLKILLEAEASLLSILLHAPCAADEILGVIDLDDFSDSKHKVVFASIKELINNRSAIDLTTLSNLLLHKNELVKAGGIEYLTELFENYLSDANLDDYLKIIINSAMIRKLTIATKHITEQINLNTPAELIVNEAEKYILEINNVHQRNQFKSTTELVKEAILNIERLASSENQLTGTPSGFMELDRLTAGFQPGDFIILAARPSMGKTALSLNFIFNSSVENHLPVAMFSLEMPAEQLIVRMLGSNAQIDSSRMRNGKGLSDRDWKNLAKVGDKLRKAELYIDDTPGLTIMELQSKLRKLTREHEIKLVVIDYLQLLTNGTGAGESRQQEVSNISRQLKALARELSIPIVCLSQLSRSVEKREDKKPIMSDLRDSGAIEQDADLIMFLYREEYYEYGNEGEFSHNQTEMDLGKDGKVAQLILAKHRNGPTGTVNLFFIQKWGTFEDMLT